MTKLFLSSNTTAVYLNFNIPLRSGLGICCFASEREGGKGWFEGKGGKGWFEGTKERNSNSAVLIAQVSPFFG